MYRLGKLTVVIGFFALGLTIQLSAANSAPVEIPAGTEIHFKLTQAINSKAAAGLQFRGVLETAMFVGDKQVAAAGTPVYGKLVESKSGGRVAGRAQLTFTLTHIVIKERRYPIVTEAYKAQGQRQGTAARTAAGAGVGAMFGGRRGARIGAATGATLSLLSPGKQVNIPAGTLLDFRLMQPLKTQ